MFWGGGDPSFPLWHKGSTCVSVKNAGSKAGRRASSIGVLALRNGQKLLTTKRGMMTTKRCAK